MLSFPKWRRKTAGPVVPELLAGYQKPGWLSRHRKLVLTLTFFLLFFYTVFFLLIGRFLIVQFTAPLAIIALLIIWALPEREQIPDELLVGFFFAFMAAMLLWPDYLAITLPSLPWITAARLIGVPMTLLLLICISQSAAFRSIIKQAMSANPTISKFLLAFTGLAVLSVGFSTSPSMSANHLIVALVNWIVVFFVALFVFSRPGNIERFVWLIWGATLFWCVLGYWEWRNSQIPWADHIPWFLAVEDPMVQRVLAGSSRDATGIYRVQGKYVTPLGLAEYMALAMPFILHLVAEGRNWLVRAGALVTLPLVFMIIMATDSRLGAVGFLLSFMFYLLFWSVRRWMHNRDSIFGPAIALSYPIIFVLFIISTFTVGRIRNMVWGDGSQDSSSDARTVQMEMGMEHIMQRPWGHGIGRGGETLGFQNGAGILTIDTYYLSILLEVGILGFIVYYGMFLVAIVRGGIRGMAVRDATGLWVIPAVISLANFVIIKSVLSQQEAHPLVFAILAMVAVILARPAVAADQQPSLPVGQFGP
jgi:hypothetical protein